MAVTDRTSTLETDLADAPLGDALMVRQPSPYGYARASWEINKGCDYDCDHCYLGLKKFEGLSWDDKTRLLEILRDAGVLWLQITGGCSRGRGVPRRSSRFSLGWRDPSVSP